MILESLLTLISIYPWNAGLSVYGTSGQYSTGEEYVSKAVYFSMDRRLKDGFTVGYEDLTITTASTTYRQYNTLARDVFWIKPQLRFGGIIGHITTNQTDDGWLWGTQVEGDLPWFGYALGYTYSDYQNWQPLFTDLNNVADIFVEQWDLSLSRWFGKHVFRTGMMYQTMDSLTYTTFSGSWVYQPTKSFFLAATYSLGESRYSIDPYTLILDNNPDILKRMFSFRAGYRFTANWSLTIVASRHNYSRIKDPDYRADYIAFGVQVRY